MIHAVTSDCAAGIIRDPIGVPRMTFICSAIASGAVVVAADSKVTWSDGRAATTAEKIFPIKNMAIGVAHSYQVGEHIVGQVANAANSIPDDVFDAVYFVKKIAHSAFSQRYGAENFASPNEFYHSDLAIYGWGELGGKRVGAQYELRSVNGFEPHHHTGGIFVLGTPQAEKGVADLILETAGSQSESEIGNVLYYAVERTIRRAPCFVGPTIRAYALSDGSPLRSISISNPQAVVRSYDDWLKKGVRP